MEAGIDYCTWISRENRTILWIYVLRGGNIVLTAYIVVDPSVDAVDDPTVAVVDGVIVIVADPFDGDDDDGADAQVTDPDGLHDVVVADGAAAAAAVGDASVDAYDDVAVDAAAVAVADDVAAADDAVLGHFAFDDYAFDDDDDAYADLVNNHAVAVRYAEYSVDRRKVASRS